MFAERALQVGRGPDPAGKIHVHIKSVSFFYGKVSVMLQTLTAYKRDKR